MERKQSSGFRCIFTVAFQPLQRALTLQGNHSNLPNLTCKNLSKATVKI